MAAYGSQLREKKTPKQAQAYLKELFQHTVSQDTSGRNALNTFLSGKGDVLLDYESDAKLAQSQGKPVYYLIPKATLQIETPLAAVNGSNRAEAQKFARGCTRRPRRRSGPTTGSARWFRASRSSTRSSSRRGRSCSRSATSAAGTR